MSISQGLLLGLVSFSVFMDKLEKQVNSEIKSKADTDLLWVQKYHSDGKGL